MTPRYTPRVQPSEPPARAGFNLFSRIGGTTFAAALAVAALGVWVVVAGGAPDRCQIGFDEAGGIVCPGDTPGMVDVDVRLDDTMARGDEQLAIAAEKRAVAYADMAIDNGGSLTISVFRRSAARGRTLLQLEIPGLQELRLSRRGASEKKAREQVAKALGVWASTSTTKSATGSASELGTGSDILAALALPGSGPRSKRAPLLRVAITDGRVNVPGFDLVAALRRAPAKVLSELRKRLPQVERDARPDGLAIFGIGGTGGHLKDEDPALTEALTQTYRRLCPELAATCYVTPRL